MWRTKKLIITAIVAAVVLVGSIGGVVLAADGDDDSQPKTLLARVAEILGIDQQTFEDAYSQAQSEMKDEALDKRLQKLVDEGKITPDQAEQYKVWLQAEPDMEPYQQQLREWQQVRPDVPVVPGLEGREGFRGHDKFRGRMGGCRGWGGMFAPAQPSIPTQ